MGTVKGFAPRLALIAALAIGIALGTQASASANGPHPSGLATPLLGAANR
jgi:hypothetical protein